MRDGDHVLEDVVALHLAHRAVLGLIARGLRASSWTASASSRLTLGGMLMCDACLARVDPQVERKNTRKKARQELRELRIGRFFGFVPRCVSKFDENGFDFSSDRLFPDWPSLSFGLCRVCAR